MSECLFCDLLAQGKLDLVYEDEQVVAFSDIAPKAKHHILVIPRKHIKSVNEATVEDEQLLGHLFTAAREITKQLGFAESGYRIRVNTGEHAGQTVHHVHMHLLGGEQLSEPLKQS